METYNREEDADSAYRRALESYEVTVETDTESESDSDQNVWECYHAFHESIEREFLPNPIVEMFQSDKHNDRAYMDDDWAEFTETTSKRLKALGDIPDISRRVVCFAEIMNIHPSRIRFGRDVKIFGRKRDIVLSYVSNSGYIYALEDKDGFKTGLYHNGKFIDLVGSQTTGEMFARGFHWVKTGHLYNPHSAVPTTEPVVHAKDEIEELESDLLSKILQLIKEPTNDIAAKVELAFLTGCGYWSQSTLTRVITGVVAALNITMNMSIMKECLARCYFMFIEITGSDTLKSILRNPNTELFKQLYRCIAYLVVPLVSEAKISMRGIDIISFEAAEKMSGMEFLEAISNLFSSMEDIINDYKMSGNMKVLFSTDEGYDTWLKNYWSLVWELEAHRQSNGNEGHPHDLAARCDKLEKEGDKIRATITDRKCRMQLYRCIHNLVTFRTDICARNRKGNYRKKAFCVSLGGDSQIGKSTISTLLFRFIHRGLGTPFNPDNKVTLRGDESYFVDIHDWTTDVQMDDVENEKNKENMSLVVRFVNNVVFDLEQAEAHLKGKCKPTPEVIVMNTNVFTQNAEEKTHCVPSVLNRMLHLWADVKDEYRNSANTLDGKKMDDEFIRKETLPDCWIFTLYKNICVPRAEPYPIKDNENKPLLHVDQKCYLEPVICPMTGKEMKEVSIYDIMRCLVGMARIHAKVEARNEETRDLNYMEGFMDIEFAADGAVDPYLIPDSTQPGLVALESDEDDDDDDDDDEENSDDDTISAEEKYDRRKKKKEKKEKEKEKEKERDKLDPEPTLVEPHGVFSAISKVRRFPTRLIERGEEMYYDYQLSEYTDDSDVTFGKLLRKAIGRDKGTLIHKRIKVALHTYAKYLNDSCILHPAVYIPKGTVQQIKSADIMISNTQHVCHGVSTAVHSAIVELSQFILPYIMIGPFFIPLVLTLRLIDRYIRSYTHGQRALSHVFSCFFNNRALSRDNRIFLALISSFASIYALTHLPQHVNKYHDFLFSKVAKYMRPKGPFCRERFIWEVAYDKYAYYAEINAGWSNWNTNMTYADTAWPKRTWDDVETCRTHMREIANYYPLLWTFNVIFICLSVYYIARKGFKRGYFNSLNENYRKIAEAKEHLRTMPSYISTLIGLAIFHQVVSVKKDVEHVKKVIPQSVTTKYEAPRIWCKAPCSRFTRAVLGSHNHTPSEFIAKISKNIILLGKRKTVVKRDAHGEAYEDTELIWVCNGLMLNATEILTTSHSLSEWSDGAVVEVAQRDMSLVNKGFSFKYYPSDCKVHDSKDMTIITIATSAANGFKDIKEYFPETNLDKLDRVIRLSRNMDSGLATNDEFRMYNTQHKIKYGAGQKVGTQIAFEYTASSFAGLCGAILITPFEKPQIMGMHVAVDPVSKKSSGIYLTREEVNGKYFVPLSESVYTEHVDEKPAIQSVIHHAISGTFDFLGHNGTHNKQNDAFVKYPIFEYLAGKGYRSDWLSSMKSVGPRTSVVSTQRWFDAVIENTHCPPINLINMACEDYFYPIRKMADDFRPLLRSEIVEGSKELNVSGLDLSTSAGGYFKCIKADLGKEVNGKFMFDAKVWKRVESLEALLAQSKDIDLPAVLGLKMEVRPEGKHQRAFHILDCCILLIMKKNLGSIFGACFRDSDMSESAAQLNPHGEGWHDLIMSLKEYDGQRVCCIDYSGFDQRIPSGVLRYIFDGIVETMREASFPERNRRVMAGLFTFLLRPIVSIHGDHVRLQDTMLSGIYGTSLIDGMVTSILLRCHAFSMKGMFNFRKFIRLRTVGDDAVFTRKWWYRDINSLNYAQSCHDLNMKVTSTDKTGDPAEDVPYSEFSFVSRGIRWDKRLQKYVGPLKMDSIVKSCMCGIKSKVVPPKEVMIDNLDTSLIEMAKYSQPEFQRWKDDILGYDPNLNHLIARASKSYQEIQDEMKVATLVIPHSNSDSGDVDYETTNVLTMQQGDNECCEEDTRVVGTYDRTGKENFDGHFVQRGIPIMSITLSKNSTLSIKLDPLNSLMTNSRIINRLNNYANFSATLCFKATLPASPFFRGQYIMAIYPKGSADHLYFDLSGDRYNTLVTQIPHVMVKPGDTQSAVLRVPWINRYEMASIVDGDFVNQYEMVIRSMTTLTYAGDEVENCTMRVMAWLEDVQVLGLTSQDAITLVPQAAEDEVATREGHVNAIASTLSSMIAKASSGLHTIETLVEPMTQAAKIGLSLASMAGLCKPNILAEDAVFRVRNFGDFSNINKASQAKKLTIDNKQNLGVGGLGIEPCYGDQMDMSVIANKRTYIGKFSMSTAQGTGDRIASIAITPFHYDMTVVSTKNSHIFSASAVPCLFFDYWNADIEITIQPVVNTFDRGEILVQYDPSGDTGTGISNQETNVNYGKICPIDGGVAHSFVITPSQQAPFMPIGPLNQPTTDRISTTSLPGYNYMNGVLTVKVYNELNTKATSTVTTVDFLVYANVIGPLKVMKPNNNFHNAKIAAIQGRTSNYIPIQPKAMVVPEKKTNMFAVVKLRRYKCGSCQDEKVTCRCEKTRPERGRLRQQILRDRARVDMMLRQANYSDYSQEVKEVVPHSNFTSEQSQETLATPSMENANLSLLYGGESIQSFRALAKRHSLYAGDTSPVDLANYRYLEIPVYPLYRGDSAIFKYWERAPATQNEVGTTYVGLIGSMYAAVRGGITWKIMCNPMGDYKSGLVTVNWFDYLGTITQYGLVPYSFGTTVIDEYPVGGTGVDMTPLDANTCIDVVAPFQTSALFHYSRDTKEPRDYNYLRVNILYATQDVKVVSYLAAGEDFQGIFYIGLPEMFFE